MTSARTIAWVLLRNEVRLAWRGMNPGSATTLIVLGSIFLVIGQGAALLIMFGFRREGLSLPTEQRTWALVASLMFGTAFLNAVRVVCERNDADLLLPAPINPGLILLTRWAGIAAGALLPAALLVPVVNAAALVLSPGYLCGYGVILLLAGAGASTGVMGALGLIRLFGVRRGRTGAQVLGAVVSALVYFSFQLPQLVDDLPAGFSRVVRQIAENPLTSSLAQAGRGGALHLGALTVTTAVLAGVTLRFFGPMLLFGFQDVASRRRVRGTGQIRSMDTRLWSAAYRKDVRLILRDPLLIAQTLPSLLYIFPALIPVYRTAPMAALTAGSVVVAGQMSNLLAGVLASGDEGWDLMRMSPAPFRSIILAKLAAALTAPLGFCLLCGVALVGLGRPLAALDLAAASFLVAVAAGWLEISNIHPSPRSDIIRRKHRGSQSIVHGFIVMIIIGVGAAGVGFATSDHWITAIVLLGVTAGACGAIVASNPIRRYPT